MNYFEIIKDSIRIFRTTKIIWLFGFLALIPNIIGTMMDKSRLNINLDCAIMLILLISLYFGIISQGGLVYLIHQKILNNEIAFKDAWVQSKKKIGSIIGLLVIISAMSLIPSLIYLYFNYHTPYSPLLWILTWIIDMFFTTQFIFGVCAIMMDDIGAFSAARLSFLVTLNNYFPVIIINTLKDIVYLLLTRLIVVIFVIGNNFQGISIDSILKYQIYIHGMKLPIFIIAGWIINVGLYPLLLIALTICYKRFTNMISYPVLRDKNIPA